LNEWKENVCQEHTTDGLAHYSPMLFMLKLRKCGNRPITCPGSAADRIIMKEMGLISSTIVQALERINGATDDSNKGIKSYLKKCLSYTGELSLQIMCSNE
jgi:hypothetical protein